MTILTKVFDQEILSSHNGDPIDLTDVGVFGGVTPKFFLIMAHVGDATPGNNHGRVSYSFGGGDDEGKALCQWVQIRDNIGTTQTNRGAPNFIIDTGVSYRVYPNTFSATPDHAGEAVVIPNGVRLTPTIHQNVDCHIIVVAFGGTGIKEAELSLFGTSGTSPVTVDLTRELRPNLIFAWTTGTGSLGDQTEAAMSTGVWGTHHGGASRTASVGYSSRDAQADSTVFSTVRDDRIICLPSLTSTKALGVDLIVDSVAPNVIEFTSTVNQDDALIYVLSVELVNPENVHIDVTDILTTDNSFNSEAHITPPLCAINWTTDNTGAAVNAFGDNVDSGTYNFGAFDGSTASYVGCADEGDQGVSDVKTVVYDEFGVASIIGSTGDFFGVPSFSGSDELEVASWSSANPSTDYRMITVLIGDLPSQRRLGTVDIIDTRLGADRLWSPV